MSSLSRRSNGRASAEIWEPGVESVYARIFLARAAPAAFAAATAARYACPACCFVIVAAAVVRAATVVGCETFFAEGVSVGLLGEPPHPARAREQALAPIPITVLTRFIAVSFGRDNAIGGSQADVYFADLGRAPMTLHHNRYTCATRRQCQRRLVRTRREQVAACEKCARRSWSLQPCLSTPSLLKPGDEAAARRPVG